MIISPPPPRRGSKPPWEKGWIVFVGTSDSDVHIVPAKDLEDHYQEGCDCQPHDLSPVDISIWLHQAWDCREAVQWYQKLLEHNYHNHYNKRPKRKDK
jgi:hypothetical protein